MSKRKILTLAMTLCMVAILAIGGTLAYFTDTDSAKNVMQMGNIAIEQTEWQRTPDGKEFAPFTQNKLLMPGVYENSEASSTKVYFNDEDTLYIADGEAWCGMWSESAKQYNAVDKIVTVQNTGKHDVYYRTLIAIEAPAASTGSWNPAAGESKLVINRNENERFVWDHIGLIEIDDVKYDVYEALYKEVLIPGEMSRPSLLQVMFSKETTQEDVAVFGDTLDILCLTQAVQKDGFKQVGAAVALDTAFGNVTTVNAAEWFDEIN